MKDYIGQEIKVGESVIFTEHNYSKIYKGTVTGLTKREDEIQPIVDVVIIKKENNGKQYIENRRIHLFVR